MKRVLGIVLRVVALFFTWTALGLAVYGIFTLQFDLVLVAAVWYFVCGGLAVQSVEDMAKVMDEN